MLYNDYSAKITEIIQKIEHTQGDKLLAAADAASRVISSDGIIYLFGCGHSHLLALDCFYRAGGLANVSVMLDSSLMLHDGAAKSSAYERMSGLAEHIYRRYSPAEGDMLIVISSSGKNPVPIEMALEAKKNGIFCIALTSSAYFDDTPRHESGKLLYQAADMWIDNCVPHGDACMTLSDGAAISPLSTPAGAFILNSILLEAAQKSIDTGTKAPIYMSGNIDGGAEYNKSLIERYLPRMKNL